MLKLQVIVNLVKNGIGLMNAAPASPLWLGFAFEAVDISFVLQLVEDKVERAVRDGFAGSHYLYKILVKKVDRKFKKVELFIFSSAPL